MSTPNTNNTPTADPNSADTPAADTPAADTPAAAPPADAPADTPADKTFTQSDLDKAVARAIKDAAKQTADAEAKAKLSEEDRSKAETLELRNQIRERDARDAVKDEAVSLGVKNPASLYKIVKDDLEFDDKGNVTNLKDVFDSAKTEFPQLFDTKPSQSIDGGAGSGATGSTLTKAQIEKMSHAEIIANMDKIDAFYAAQK